MDKGHCRIGGQYQRRNTVPKVRKSEHEQFIRWRLNLVGGSKFVHTSIWNMHSIIRATKPLRKPMMRIPHGSRDFADSGVISKLTHFSKKNKSANDWKTTELSRWAKSTISYTWNINSVGTVTKLLWETPVGDAIWVQGHCGIQGNMKADKQSKIVKSRRMVNLKNAKAFWETKTKLCRWA